MILVTGATGVMGVSLIESLYRKGYRCRALVLDNDPGAERIRPFVSEIVYGDITDKERLRGVCRGVDTVYHLAAVIIAFDKALFEKVNYRGTENLLNESLRQGVEHFIYVSSASVVYKHTTAYSRSKMRSELLIKESGINYTIIRPTLVYDFGKGSAEFDRFLDYLRAFPVIPFIGNGNAVKRPVHVDAVKRGLVSICYNERTYNKTYNFSGVQPLKMKELAAFCLILLNMRKKKIIYIPVGICRIISYIMGMIRSEPPLRWQVVAGVIQDADLDPSAAIEETGFTESDVFRDLPKCFPREG